MSVVSFGREKRGAGKTTLATNMAAMLAQTGKDVLPLYTDRRGTPFLGSLSGKTLRVNLELPADRNSAKGRDIRCLIWLTTTMSL